ncbi:hypothetical protein LX32DRAFT_710935 [Colletotrichum zoysiae]|uniref:Uncharacterized protein n=1 Tax=Colletotrichum zoysiae TaxID=1216348 RepID=A0AAD9H699_9PEZI|nr:hypothetical protein LX32DRAFT_710935 [Colletotrichum zoysiae]
MRYSIFFFFFAPAAVLGKSGGDPQAGPFYYTRNGVADPSGTCKGMGLNSFACESFAKNNAPPFAGDSTTKKGCDKPELSGFPVGRDVKGFVASSKDTIPVGPDQIGNSFTAWIGCA